MSYLHVSTASAGAGSGTHSRVILGRGAAADGGSAAKGGAEDERNA